MGKFLEISDLVKYYGQGESRVKVLQGITAGVNKGSICVILGSSGCGNPRCSIHRRYGDARRRICQH